MSASTARAPRAASGGHASSSKRDERREGADSIEACAARFEEIRPAVEADVSGEDEALGQALGEIVRDALALEAADTAADLVALLEGMAASTTNNLTTSGLVLNNLGCVERRRGNLKAALGHLRRAAQAEGGIVTASPATLLNISAVYSGLQMYAEAASVSNHAVQRCESDVQPVSAVVHAAALYNLAAALEGSGELEHAEGAYARAAAVLDKGGVAADHPQRRATAKAREQLELRLRNHRGNARREEWARDVLPSIIRRAADKSVNKGAPAGFSPKPSTAPAASSSGGQQSPPRRLNPLESRGMRSGMREEAMRTNASGNSGAANNSINTINAADRSASRSGPEHDAALGLLSTDGRRTTRSGSAAASLAVTVGGRDLGAQYHSTVRDFHVFPVNSRAANRRHKTIVNPTWDMNPLPHTPSVVRSLGRDPTVERAVSQTYIPHHLVPFVADLKYKEHTRRTMIATEHAERMLRFHAEWATSACGVREDEERVDLEIAELRARRVMGQWFKGKLVFASHYSGVEAEERAGRHAIHKELADHSLALQPRARMLQLQVEEEVARRALLRAEGTAERNELRILEGTARARLASKEAAQTPKQGIAHGLALWCLEGAVPPAAALRLADPAYLSSSYVQSRHLWFGKPFGYSKLSAAGRGGAAGDASAGGAGVAANAGDFDDDEFQ